MSISPTITPVAPPVQHSEGPLWDHEHQFLYFVDTFQATIYRTKYLSNKVSSHKLDNHDSIAIIVPIKNREYQFIVAADRSVYEFAWPHPGKNISLKELLAIEKDKPSNQLNDGKVDPSGRVWLGSLKRNKDLTVEPHGGSLYVMYNKFKNLDEMIGETSISNGMDWSPDLKKFYYIDSTTMTVVGFDYDVNSGKIGNKTTVFDLEDFPNLKGIPDGMTVDNKGNLWIALFGGHSIINVDPKTSELLRTVELPATYVTSACFGGPNLDILFVTTSRLHLDESGINEEPLAGSVFAVQNLGVSGKLSFPAVL